MEGQPFWYETHPEGFALVQQPIADEEPGILFVSKEISVGYTFERSGSFITHKHGPPALVEAWARETQEALRKFFGESRSIPLSMLPRVVTSSIWEVEDLNWAILNVNGLNRLASKLAGLGLIL